MPNPSSHAHLNASSSSGLPPATTPAASTPTSTSAPRARAQGARKRAAAADDAAYHAPLAGTKRTAGDRGDGDRERERVKRKRVADASALPPTNGNAAEKEEKTSLVSLLPLLVFMLRYLFAASLPPGRWCALGSMGWRRGRAWGQTRSCPSVGILGIRITVCLRAVWCNEFA